jgi:cell fate (sporulation/competence/biofilm development) regulator YlbF (YheA/YmcA/DUF963 family)
MINLQTEAPVFAAGDVSEPLHRLAAQLQAQPTFTRFFDAYRAMQADAEAQALLAELRAAQYQGLDETGYHRLLQQFYGRPSVKTYQAAEEELYDLVQTVDAVISEAAGIDFAVNAKRSCCGG